MNSYKQHLFISCIRIAANMLMVVAVFVAMYLSSLSIHSGELVFCAWFFGITVSDAAGSAAFSCRRAEHGAITAQRA